MSGDFGRETELSVASTSKEGDDVLEFGIADSSCGPEEDRDAMLEFELRDSGPTPEDVTDFVL